jgi:hypothetical protein
MPAGGWFDTEKQCPKSGCDGVLYAKKVMNESREVSHMAVKCSKKGHFEKRGRYAQMKAYLKARPERVYKMADDEED